MMKSVSKIPLFLVKESYSLLSLGPRLFLHGEQNADIMISYLADNSHFPMEIKLSGIVALTYPDISDASLNLYAVITLLYMLAVFQYIL